MSRAKVKPGDWVLYKTKHGKIWKLCEVKENTRQYNDRVILMNLKAQRPEWSDIWTYDGDIIVPVPKGTDTKSMKMSTLVALYANKNSKNIDDWTFFQKSPKATVRFEFDNEDQMDEFFKSLDKLEGYKVKEQETDLQHLHKKYKVTE